MDEEFSCLNLLIFKIVLSIISWDIFARKYTK